VLANLNLAGWQAFLWQGKTRTPQQAQHNVQKKTEIKLSWHRPDVIGRLGNQILQSYAADIVDERWGWEGEAKNLNHQFWEDLSRYSKSEGLEWGGDWPKKDVAPVQMKLIDSRGGGVRLWCDAPRSDSWL
jgi:hypothetical protein